MTAGDTPHTATRRTTYTSTPDTPTPTHRSAKIDLYVRESRQEGAPLLCVPREAHAKLSACAVALSQQQHVLLLVFRAASDPLAAMVVLCCFAFLLLLLFIVEFLFLVSPFLFSSDFLFFLLFFHIEKTFFFLLEPRWPKHPSPPWSCGVPFAFLFFFLVVCCCLFL